MKGIRRKSRRLILEAGIIGVLLIAGFTGAIEYTSQSSFCTNCHEMKPIYETWKTSRHGGVECISCHSDPGVIGLLQTKTQALEEVYRHITGTYKKPIVITADTSKFSERCLRCHEDIKGQGDAHNNIHFAMNVACTECHLGLVHNPKTNNKLPSKKVCGKCHGNSSG